MFINRLIASVFWGTIGGAILTPLMIPAGGVNTPPTLEEIVIGAIFITGIIGGIVFSLLNNGRRVNLK